MNNQKVVFRVDFDFADSVFFDLVGDFRGPEVNFVNLPALDFGLLKSFSEKETKIKIKNFSTTEASCRLSLLEKD